MAKITYRAFGRDHDTTSEAEAYGQALMADTSKWTGITPPTSFVLFILTKGCLPTDLYRVYKADE